MPNRQVSLTGGDYRARWLGANAQRSLNWFPENNPPESPFPYTDYPTPGLGILSLPPVNGPARMLYRTSQGDAYACVGQVVYHIDQSFAWTPIQTLTTNGPVPVSMSDNGLVGLVVDGSTNGYAIDLASRVSLPINDGGTGAFYGANRVDFLDTFFLLNRPGTAQFYISLSEVTQAMLTGGPVVTGAILIGGAGFINGVYYLVPLTGGEGSGATAVVTVAGGVVTDVVIVDPGASYRADDVLSANLHGNVTGGDITGGVGYLDGEYPSTALTGGTGTGAFGDITVEGGTVTAVSNLIGGVGYAVGDLLSASTVQLGPNGSGFIFKVNAVSGSGAGFSYKLSAVGSSAFDPLDIAAKTGFADPLANGPVAMHREVWLLGTLTSEVFYNAGAADFPFQAFPGVFIQHGVLAPWSIAAQDITLFWLSNDEQGRAIVVSGSNYTATRISTYAIEDEFQNYPTLTDAVAFIHQMGGHTFYVLNFPTANRTWAYDVAEGLWHERCWLDQDGNENRARPQVYANAYGYNLCLDWQNGALYQIDPNRYNDFGGPIKRLRSFPHLTAGGNRQQYLSFMIDVETGSILPDTNMGGMPAIIADPQVSMRYSDNRGETFGNYTTRGLGSAGAYNRYPMWYRCGMGRDRVFEVSTSVDAEVSINGAYIVTNECSS